MQADLASETSIQRPHLEMRILVLVEFGCFQTLFSSIVITLLPKRLAVVESQAALQRPFVERFYCTFAELESSFLNQRLNDLNFPQKHVECMPDL